MAVRIFLSIFALVNQQINENENGKRKRKNYDKRRTNVQRGAAAESNSEMQSDDDGLCDDGDTGTTAEDEGLRAVP